MHYASHFPSNSGRGKETCSFRVDQGPLMVVDACVLTEEHHVFHVGDTCASGFPPKEGERKGRRRQSQASNHCSDQPDLLAMFLPCMSYRIHVAPKFRCLKIS